MNVEAALAELGRLLGRPCVVPQPSASSSPQPAAPAQPASAPDQLLPTMQDRYRVLVDQIPAVVFMAFLGGGVSEAYVSPQIERLLGFSREEWLDDPIRWYQQIHPEDRQRWSIEAAELFLTGTELKSVYRVIARDGRVVWFHCEAKLVRRPDGQPWFIHGVGFDITDLKRTEQALQQEIAERERLQKMELERQIAKAQQSESRLAAIVESSEDAIIGKSLDGTITDWNAAATRLLGYQPHEILGKSVLLLVPPELHEDEMEIFRKLKAGERIEHQETRRLNKAGEALDLLITISPIRGSFGEVIGASTIMRDIAERKRAEERLRITEKLAAAGRLAATIAHEINNPLEAVTNLIYLAKGFPALPADVRQYLEDADAELRRVAHIARQTLGFYRDTTVPVTISLPQLMSSLLEMYSSRIHNKELRIQTRYETDQVVSGRLGEIRQIFSNLIANAIDAAPLRGSLVVHVAASRNWKSPRQTGIRVSIADDGKGIPVHLRPKLFEPFFSTKQHYGTGLGLWVSKSLAEKHGGYIRFRSSVQESCHGSVFSVFLPAEPEAAAVPSAA